MTRSNPGEGMIPSTPNPLLEEAMGQLRSGRSVKATATLDSAALLTPDDPRVDLARIRVDAARQDHIGVLLAAERVLSHVPEHAESLFHKAHALYLLGRLDRAIEVIRSIDASGNPQLEHNLRAIGVKCLLRRGRTTEAADDLERLAGVEGESPRILLLRIESAHRSGDADVARRYCRTLLDSSTATPADRMAGGLELARLLDREGRYEEAAEVAHRANDLGARPFDSNAFEQQANAVVDFFSHDEMDRLPRPTPDLPGADRPIFIVGMPRSGTSLLEQIVAAHPDADGVGERQEPFLIDEDFAERLGQPSPIWLRAATPELLDAASNRYARMLEIMEAQGRLVTNKALGLDRQVGFLATLFPESRFLWIRRAPADNRLSIWLHQIHQNWAWRTGDIDLARGIHDRLHDHWTKVLPGRVLSLQYEEMVGHQERETARVLEFLKLPAASTCLEFHRSERTVMTPSIDQVRRPMNRDAIGRADRYRNTLFDR